jgi:16S rRNA (cytidine1402-2'-O)-methyltransferase
MPGISDPGAVLVRACLDAGLTVETVPGPSAVLTALVQSGLPTDRFAFEGFLPRKPGPRRRRLRELADDPRTLVFYVAPHRAAEDLAAMAEAFGDRPAALGRELTKLHEEVWRGSLAQLAARVGEGVRGELTVVIGSAPQVVDAPGPEVLARRVRGLMAAGSTRREAIAEVARACGAPKRQVYDAVLGSDAGKAPQADD